MFRVPGTSLWCDAPGRVAMTFLSRAGIATRARRVIATQAVAAAARLAPDRVLSAASGRPFGLGSLDLTAFDAAADPPSAMLLAVKHSGRRILFASLPAATPADPPVECDILVLDPPASPGFASHPPALVDAFVRLVESSRPTEIRLPRALDVLQARVHPGHPVRWVFPPEQMRLDHTGETP